MYLTLETCNNFNFVLEIKNLFSLELSGGVATLTYNVDFYITNHFYKLTSYFKAVNLLSSLTPMYTISINDTSNIYSLSNNSFKLGYTGIKFFIPFNYEFLPRLYDYMWYVSIIIWKLFNNPIVKLLLAAILYYILGFIKFLYNIVTRGLMIYLVFFSRFAVVGAYPIIRDAAIDKRSILLILFTLGNLSFFCINLLFDYYSFRITDRNIFNNIMLGLIYLFNIVAGVLGSNGTYYYNHTSYNGTLYTIISLTGTIIFSSMWFIMSINPTNMDYIIINNTFRSILEVLTFNSASWLTYDLWTLWLRINNANYLALIFLPLYLLVGPVLIYIEMSGARNRNALYFLGYGIIYTLTFTFLAFFTNSLFDFYILYSSSDSIRVLIIILSAIATTILFPDIYRERRRITVSVNNNNYLISIWCRAFILSFYFLLLFISFVFLTGILNLYIMPQ